MHQSRYKNYHLFIALALSAVIVLGVFSIGRAIFERDKIAPRTPINLAIKTIENGLEISWQENNEWDIFTYVLSYRKGNEREGKRVMTGRTDHYVINNISAENNHYVSLSAKDIAGNESKFTPEIGIAPQNARLQKSFLISAWVPGQDIEEQQKKISDNVSLFDQISPFEYRAEEDGKISRVTEVLNNDLRSKLKEKGVKIIPTINNNYDENDRGSKIIEDEGKRNGHIDIISREVEEKGYDGIDLDYENLKPEIKDKFSEFVEKLAEKLHSKSKILSITVQPKTSNYQFDRGAGATDYSRLAKAADQIRIMSYDAARLNTAPGAVSPRPWFEKVLDFAKNEIPKDKIIAGIPFYGYQWCLEKKTDACKSKGLLFEGVKKIIEEKKPEVQWNDETKAPWFLYEKDGNKFAVNFEDKRSLEEKIDAIKNAEVRGISIWRLGYEDPESLNTLREKLTRKVGPPKGLKIIPQNASVKLDWEKEDYKTLKGYRLVMKKESENVTSENAGALGQTFDVLGKNDYVIENLENGKNYYLSFIPLFWEDDISPNLSQDSTQNLPLSFTPMDYVKPANIADLKVEEIGTTTLKINWRAPGNDDKTGKAEKYELRYSTEALDQDNFYQAKKYEELPKPEEPNELQEITLADLDAGETYYLAMLTFDAAGNFSEVSNIVSAKTIDNIPPKIPSGLQIYPFSNGLKIKWSKNTERDLAGYKLYYKQEQSYWQEKVLGPKEDDFDLKDLENGYTYFVALLAFDNSGNESAKTNEISGAPKAGDFYEKMENMTDKEMEKAYGAAIVFGRRVVNPAAIPYLVMLSILILNFFIFRVLKSEISRKTAIRTVSQQSAYISPKTTTKQQTSGFSKRPIRPWVIDLRKIKKRVKPLDKI